MGEATRAIDFADQYTLARQNETEQTVASTMLLWGLL